LAGKTSRQVMCPLTGHGHTPGLRSRDPVSPSSFGAYAGVVDKIHSGTDGQNRQTDSESVNSCITMSGLVTLCWLKQRPDERFNHRRYTDLSSGFVPVEYGRNTIRM
jgi:hypothetical protein